MGLMSEKYFWIGLSDIQEKGTFKWTSGEAVLFTHWNSEMPGIDSTIILVEEYRAHTALLRI